MMELFRTPNNHKRKDEVEETDQSSDEGEVLDITYPSGYLSILTRKRNKLLKHLKAKNPGNYHKVKSYFAEFQDNVKHFVIECQQQLGRTDVSNDIKIEFNNWYTLHSKTNQDFEYKVAKWLKEAEQFDTSGIVELELPIGETRKDKNDNSSDNNKNKVSASLISESSLVDILAKQNELTSLLAQNQIRSMLPQSEPEVFSGDDPVNYNSFKLSFQRIIETRTNDSADLYYCLMKYTKGEAHALVKSCNSLNVSDSYSKAMRLLDKKYGNQYLVANHYLSKLENWPYMKNEDPKALRELSMFLTQCESMMQNMSGMNQLNGPKEIRDCVKKLPYDLQRKFRELATRKLEQEQPVMFKDLVKFVSVQSNILDTPIFGELGRRPEKEKKSQKSFFTKKENNPCPCCKKKNHELDDCTFFLQKSNSEKSNFIKEKKLCFGCLKNSNPTHTSKTCKNKIVCKTCNNKHPTSLHYDKKAEPPVNNNTGMQSW